MERKLAICLNAWEIDFLVAARHEKGARNVMECKNKTQQSHNNVPRQSHFCSNTKKSNK